MTRLCFFFFFFFFFFSFKTSKQANNKEDFLPHLLLLFLLFFFFSFSYLHLVRCTAGRVYPFTYRAEESVCEGVLIVSQAEWKLKRASWAKGGERGRKDLRISLFLFRRNKLLLLLLLLQQSLNYLTVYVTCCRAVALCKHQPHQSQSRRAHWNQHNPQEENENLNNYSFCRCMYVLFVFVVVFTITQVVFVLVFLLLQTHLLLFQQGIAQGQLIRRKQKLMSRWWKRTFKNSIKEPKNYLFIFKWSLLFAFGFLFKHHKVLILSLFAVGRAGKRILSLGFARRLLPIGTSTLKKKVEEKKVTKRNDNKRIHTNLEQQQNTTTTKATANSKSFTKTVARRESLSCRRFLYTFSMSSSFTSSPLCTHTHTKI